LKNSIRGGNIKKIRYLYFDEPDSAVCSRELTILDDQDSKAAALADLEDLYKSNADDFQRATVTPEEALLRVEELSPVFKITWIQESPPWIGIATFG
jgi:hypothetical protein